MMKKNKKLKILIVVAVVAAVVIIAVLSRQTAVERGGSTEAPTEVVETNAGL